MSSNMITIIAPKSPNQGIKIKNPKNFKIETDNTTFVKSTNFLFASKKVFKTVLGKIKIPEINAI